MYWGVGVCGCGCGCGCVEREGIGSCMWCEGEGQRLCEGGCVDVGVWTWVYGKGRDGKLCLCMMVVCEGQKPRASSSLHSDRHRHDWSLKYDKTTYVCAFWFLWVFL